MNAPPCLRGDRAPILALVGLATFLLEGCLWPGRSLWFRDVYGYWSMQAECFVRVVAEGGLPLWNPAVSFGMPMLADPSYQIAYPPTWLNLVVGIVAYYKVFAVLHAAWAGVGLYLLLRRFALVRGAAFVGAAAFVASGPYLVVASHTHHFAGVSWAPWVLLALDRALARPGLDGSLRLGLAAAAQVLAGSADLCLMTAFVGLGLVLARRMGPAGAAPPWRATALTLAGAGAMALGLSAIQWLPALSMLRAGQRLGMTDATRLYWSLHPASLVDFLVPGFVAELPLGDAARAALFEAREPLFAAQYLGAASVGLVLLGAVACRGPLRALAALGLPLAVLLTLGRHTPVYAALAGLTPLGLFRFPSKYSILVGLFWALLAGLGTEAWLRGEVKVRLRRAAAGLCLVLAVLAFACGVWLRGLPAAMTRHLDPQAGAALDAPALKLFVTGGLLSASGILLAAGAGRLARAARVALPILAVADLARAGRGVNPPGPAELLTGRPTWRSVVPEGSRLYVSQSADDLALARVPAGWKPAWATVLGRIELAWPPLGARAGYEGSFDGDFTGLASPLVSNLTLIIAGAEGSPVATRLLRIGGVEYVVTAGPTEWPGFARVAETTSALRDPVRVLRVPEPAPRAYFVGRARFAGEPRSILLLREESFDVAREAVLAGAGPDRGSADARGQVRTIETRADRLRLEVEAAQAGYVVVLRTFDRGWTARVNGAPAELQRANVLFQAVAVPAGRSRVELVYRPATATLGAALTGLSALAALGAVALSTRRARFDPVRSPL